MILELVAPLFHRYEVMLFPLDAVACAERVDVAVLQLMALEEEAVSAGPLVPMVTVAEDLALVWTMSGDFTFQS